VIPAQMDGRPFCVDHEESMATSGCIQHLQELNTAAAAVCDFPVRHAASPVGVSCMVELQAEEDHREPLRPAGTRIFDLFERSSYIGRLASFDSLSSVSKLT
jgi:hypothetical protein